MNAVTRRWTRMDARRKAKAGIQKERDRAAMALEGMKAEYGKAILARAMRRTLELWRRRDKAEKLAKQLRAELRALEHGQLPR